MSDPITDPVTDTLFAQLADNPDDRALLAVLADQLQSRGDVRGELVVLQLAVADGNRDSPLALRRAELLHELAPPLEPGDRLTWGTGFVRAISLLERSRKQLEAGESLWSHPSLALLGELAIETRGYGDSRALGRVVELAPRTLRSFIHTTQRADSLPELDVFQQLPRLDTLALDGMGAFAKLVHPRLRRLELTLHQPFAQLSVLTPRALPEAVELAFHGTAEARDYEYLVDVLASTGWLARVTHLALLAGQFTELGLAQLERALSGRRLARLDLTGTRMLRASRPRAAALCDELVMPTLADEPADEVVEHTGKPEWGRGRVVRRFDNKIEIEFPDVGRRVFRADAAFLVFRTTA